MNLFLLFLRLCALLLVILALICVCGSGKIASVGYLVWFTSAFLAFFLERLLRDPHLTAYYTRRDTERTVVVDN